MVEVYSPNILAQNVSQRRVDSYWAPFPRTKESTFGSDQEEEILKWLPTRYNEPLSSINM